MTPVLLQRWRDSIDWMTGWTIPYGMLKQMTPENTQVQGDKVVFRVQGNLTLTESVHGIVRQDPPQ